MCDFILSFLARRGKGPIYVLNALVRFLSINSRFPNENG